MKVTGVELELLTEPNLVDLGSVFGSEFFHGDYSLAPEKMTMEENVLSSYTMILLERGFKSTAKLIQNLKNKEKYITHYRNLRLYLQLGLKIKKNP